MKLESRGRFNLKRWSRSRRPRARHRVRARACAPRERAGRRDFVFAWNRGLGDIALGLVPLFARIRAQDPRQPHRGRHARRSGGGVRARRRGRDPRRARHWSARSPVDPSRRPMRRRASRCPLGDRVRRSRSDALARRAAAGVSAFACAGDAEWNALADDRCAAEPRRHRDRRARELGDRAVLWLREGLARRRVAGAVRAVSASRNVRWLLFGNVRATTSSRRRTSSTCAGRRRSSSCSPSIRNRCRILVAPDSGVLTAAYYLADDFPLDVISLWSDPRQGILKQGCPSPNRNAAPRRAARPRRGRAQYRGRRRGRGRARARSIAVRRASPLPPRMLRRTDPGHPLRPARGAVVRARVFALLALQPAVLGVHLFRAGRGQRPHLCPLDRVRPRARCSRCGSSWARCSPTASRSRCRTAYLWAALVAWSGWSAASWFWSAASRVHAGRRSAPRSAGALRRRRFSMSPPVPAAPLPGDRRPRPSACAVFLSVARDPCGAARRALDPGDDAGALARRRRRVLDVPRSRRSAAAAAARAAAARLWRRARRPSSSRSPCSCCC